MEFQEITINFEAAWDCFGPINEDDDIDAYILTSEQIFGKYYLEGLVFEMFTLSAIHPSEEMFFDTKDANPCRGRVADIHN